MNRTSITLVMGIVIGAAAVATPALGSHHAARRDITVRTGDYLAIPTLDVSCSVFGSDPAGHLTGPIFYCHRRSVSHSWNVTVSRRWIQVGNPQGYIVWQHPRLP
jgi:hypothetical protein